MELFEYIKSQLPQMPNSAIMKQLGASQELIDYVKETPENTNFAIAEVIEGSGGGGDAEVWLIGDEYQDEDGMRSFTLENADATDHITELFTNGVNYKMFLNGIELPYYSTPDVDIVRWMDSEDEANFTAVVYVTNNPNMMAAAGYADASTAPTSVEVSVKAK